MFWMTVETVLSLLLVIGVGFYLGGASWFGEKGTTIISKYVLNIGIPCYMVVIVFTSIATHDRLLEVFYALPIPFVTILILYTTANVLMRLFRLPEGRRGIFVNSASFCNCVVMGFIFVQALLGDDAMPEAMVYYMANTLLFWTLGVHALFRDKDHSISLFSIQGIKRVATPILLAFLAAVVLVMFSVKLPDFLYSAINTVGRTGTPLATMFIGFIIRQTDFKKIKLSRDLVLIVFTRFLISPALMLGVCLLLPIAVQLKQVLFIFSTMPAMTQMSIMSKESGNDYEFASIVVTITTIFCIIFVPVYMTLMQQFSVFG